MYVFCIRVVRVDDARHLSVPDRCPSCWEQQKRRADALKYREAGLKSAARTPEGGPVRLNLPLRIGARRRLEFYRHVHEGESVLVVEVLVLRLQPST